MIYTGHTSNLGTLEPLSISQSRSTSHSKQRMSRTESPLPFFDAPAQDGILSVGPVPQYTSGDGSLHVFAPSPPPPPDVAADASGGQSVYVLAPPPPPRSPDVDVDTTTDAPGADPAVRRRARAARASAPELTHVPCVCAHQSTQEGCMSLLGKCIRRRFGVYGVFTGRICGYNTSTRKYYIEYEVHAPCTSRSCRACDPLLRRTATPSTCNTTASVRCCGHGPPRLRPRPTLHLRTRC